MATVDLGKLAFVNKGTWSCHCIRSKRRCQHTDHNETSTYLAVQASTNQAPSTNGTINTSNWSLLAKGTTLASNNQGTYNARTTYEKGDGSNILIAELLRLFFTSILRLHQDKYLHRYGELNSLATVAKGTDSVVLVGNQCKPRFHCCKSSLSSNTMEVQLQLLFLRLRLR